MEYFLLILLAAWLLLGPLVLLALQIRTRRKLGDIELELLRLKRQLNAQQPASPVPGQTAALEQTTGQLDAAAVATARALSAEQPNTAGGDSRSTPPVLQPAALPPPLPQLGSAAETPSARPAATLAPKPAAADKPQRSRIEFERLIGVRGAALGGGALLALAAVLLFKHAFDQGWIQPPQRIAVGVATGLAALVGSQFLHRSRAQVLPGALAGAGLVAWYASTWAAHRLYGYLSATGATPLFIAITVVGGLLAVRRPSQTVAVIGLLGGYATPLLLAVQSPEAPSFFGYILLLELGVLWVALHARFGLLPLLAVVIGGLLQLYWVLRYAQPENFSYVLAALAAQALLFSLAGSGARAQRWPVLDWARAATLTLCGLAGLAFANEATWRSFGPGQGLLFASVLAGAFYIERRDRAPLLLAPVLALVSALAPGFAWWRAPGAAPSFATEGRELALMWLFPLLVALVTALLDRRQAPTWRRAAGPLIAGLASGLAVSATALVSGRPAATWLLLPLLVALLLLTWLPAPVVSWRNWLRSTPGPQLAGLLTGLAAIGFSRVRGGAPQVETWPLYALGGWSLAAVGCALFGSGQALAARRAGAALALAAAASLTAAQRPELAWLPLVVALASGASAWLLRRSNQGLAAWVVLALLASAQVQWALQFQRQGHEPYLALIGLGLTLLLVLVVVARVGADPSGQDSAPELNFGLTAGWSSTALPLALLALPALAPLDFLWKSYAQRYMALGGALLGNQGPAGSAALLGGLCAVAWALARGRAASIARALWMLAALLLALALGRLLGGPKTSLTIAGALAGWSAFGPRPSLPLGQMERAQWLALAAAGVGLLMAWVEVASDGFTAHDPRLFSREALAYAASGLFAALGASQLANNSAGVSPKLGQDTGNQANSPAGLTGVAGLTGAGESSLGMRTDPRSARSFNAQSWAGAALGICALLFGLAASSALALDAFATDGQKASIRHLTSAKTQTLLSLAWALYALALLIFGQRRKLGLLRWASLAVLCLALAKLFLYDLSDLRGLYRVASIAGLALSLFGVSWIYQRLVFKPTPP